MKLRQAKKISRKHAALFGWPYSPYIRAQLGRALRRYEKMFSLQRKHACECGRQRFKQSTKVCTYCGKEFQEVIIKRPIQVYRRGYSNGKYGRHFWGTYSTPEHALIGIGIGCYYSYDPKSFEAVNRETGEIIWPLEKQDCED